VPTTGVFLILFSWPSESVQENDPRRARTQPWLARCWRSASAVD